MTRARSRHAFTMLELLITIVIIGILVSLLFPVFGMIRRQQKKVETRGVMDHLSLALQQYLDTYPILGIVKDAISSDFVDSPWTFLGRNRIASNNEPYIDPIKKYLGKGPAAGPFFPATRDDADQICDAFTTADHSNHFYWAIVNGKGSGSPTFNFTDEIWFRSAVGTPVQPKDDLIMHFTLKRGQWIVMPYAEAIADPLPPVATFWNP